MHWLNELKKKKKKKKKKNKQKTFYTILVSIKIIFEALSSTYSWKKLEIPGFKKKNITVIKSTFYTILVSIKIIFEADVLSSTYSWKKLEIPGFNFNYDLFENSCETKVKEDERIVIRLICQCGIKNNIWFFKAIVNQNVWKNV